jgi:hypothetical protein
MSQHDAEVGLLDIRDVDTREGVERLVHWVLTAAFVFRDAELLIRFDDDVATPARLLRAEAAADDDDDEDPPGNIDNVMYRVVDSLGEFFDDPGGGRQISREPPSNATASAFAALFVPFQETPMYELSTLLRVGEYRYAEAIVDAWRQHALEIVNEPWHTAADVRANGQILTLALAVGRVDLPEIERIVNVLPSGWKRTYMGPAVLSIAALQSSTSALDSLQPRWRTYWTRARRAHRGLEHRFTDVVSLAMRTVVPVYANDEVGLVLSLLAAHLDSEYIEDMGPETLERFAPVLLGNPSIRAYLETTDAGAEWVRDNYEELSKYPVAFAAVADVMARLRQSHEHERQHVVRRMQRQDRARVDADRERRRAHHAARPQPGDAGDSPAPVRRRRAACINQESVVTLAEFDDDDDVVTLVANDAGGARGRGRCYVRRNLIRALEGARTWVTRASTGDDAVFLRTPASRALLDNDTALDVLRDEHAHAFDVVRVDVNTRTRENLYELRARAASTHVGMDARGAWTWSPVGAHEARARGLVDPDGDGVYWYSPALVRLLERGARRAGVDSVRWPHRE